MKVLVHIDDVLGFHYGVDLEIMMRHIEKGDEVHAIVCSGGLKVCPANHYHEERICCRCRSKRQRGFGIDELREIEKHEANLEKYRKRIEIPEVNSIQELKDTRWEAASTVITALREPNPNIEKNSSIVKRSIFTAEAMYMEAINYIEKLGPDRCYVFNGRRASQMPVVRACWKKGIEIYTYEGGHSSNKFILVEGTYFHDIENKKEEIERYWREEKDEEKKRKKARKFFKDRRYGKGVEFPEAQFKEGQSDGKLPDGFNTNRRNIAIFNSSQDEFAAIEGYENPVYEGQMCGINRIIESEKISDDIKFYIRVHPNLRNVDNSQTDKIGKIESENTEVISADSSVDSYTLMESCEKVITFGSAMSIESAYAGKPSILIGREPYEDTGSCYTPESHQEAVELINDPDLPPRDRTGALKYGYYMVSRDREFKFFDPEDNSLHGQPLEASRASHYLGEFKERGLGGLFRFAFRRIRHHLGIEQ